jgi:metal-sulfur cluster biosynthetic enzyme
MVAVVMEPAQLGAEMAVLKHVIDHVVGIAVAALGIVKGVAVNAHLAVVAHVDMAVLVHVMEVATELAQGHAQMIVRILVQGTAKAAVVQAAQIVMVVVIAEVAMEVAVMAVILLVIHQLTLKEWRFQWV